MQIVTITIFVSYMVFVAEAGNAIAQAPAPPKPAAALNAQEIETRVRVLEFQLKALQERVRASRSATLDCNSGKYDEFLFQTGSLIFFAACTKIEPYLEGHRITVNIGNPHSFNFSNVKGSLQYGKDVLEVIKKNQKVDVSVMDTIRSGSWNTITVIVNPSKPEDMRYLYLELSAEAAESMR